MLATLQADSRFKSGGPGSGFTVAGRTVIESFHYFLYHLLRTTLDNDMKTLITPTLLSIFFAASFSLMAQSTNTSPVIAPGAKLEKLAGGFIFTEGPTCDSQGNIFF